MKDVLEQAAKAMHAAECGLTGLDRPDLERWEDVPEERKRGYRTYARAAFPVFREHFAQQLEAEARNPRWAGVRRLHVLDAAASLRTTEG